MTGIKRNIYHLVFAAILICLACFKWHDLGLPYFWDELGVYGQMADYQVHHGISLAPASVPRVLSRGHPLLFSCMNAKVEVIFGEHVFVTHLFCFFISALLLLVVYLKIKKYFNPVTGLVCVAIIAMQPLFLAQSGLVIPEITLALFIFMALCSYYESRFILFALFATLAMLTKELAIVLPVTVIFYSMLQWITEKVRPEALKLNAIVCTITPYIVFAGFLLLQKYQNGWYFFPYHLDSVAFNVTDFMQQFKSFSAFIFCMQGRYVLGAASILALLLSALNNRKLTWPQPGFLTLLVLSGIAFCGLSSVFSVYMGRYVTVVVIVFCIVAGTLISAALRNHFYAALMILILLGVSCRYLEDTQFNYDEDLGYRREVHVLLQGVNELVKTAKPDDKVFSNFPGYFALTFAEGGYLSGKGIDESRLNNKGDYYLLLCQPGAELKTDTNQYAMSLLKSFNDGDAGTKLYWVKKK